MQVQEQSETSQPLGYASTQDNNWPSLIWLVAVAGVAVGACRVFHGIADSVYHGAPAWRVWLISLAASPWFVSVAALNIVLGAALILAGWACVYRREWGRVLLMLVEQAAIILILVMFFATLVWEASRDAHEGIDEQLHWRVGWVIREAVVTLSYPVLAVAILRRPAARDWFVDHPEDSADAIPEPR